MDFLNDITIEKSYWNTHSVLIPFIFSNDTIITILKSMTSSERGSIFEMEETHKKLECFNVPIINFNRGKMVLRNNLKSAKKLAFEIETEQEKRALIDFLKQKNDLQPYLWILRTHGNDSQIQLFRCDFLNEINVYYSTITLSINVENLLEKIMDKGYYLCN